MARRRILIAIATLGAFAFTATQAAAHTEKTSSEASVVWGGSSFVGDVESSQRCIENRDVSLFRRGENAALASVVTNAEGSWSAGGLARTNGDYYAKVAKRVLKRNENHKHICKAAKSTSDAKVRDCDAVTLFDFSGGGGSQNIDVDDDLVVDVDGVEVFSDADGVAGSLPPINLGPLNFGQTIGIVASNSPLFGTGPVSLEPIYAQCSSAGGSGSVALDATGVPPGGDADAGEIFYDETYPLPVISLSR